MRSHLVIAISLLYFYGILDSHPIDVGLPSPLKELLHDEYEKGKTLEEANEVLNDPSSSQEEKEKALMDLDAIGALV